MKRSLLILTFLLFSIAQANCQKVKNIRITEPEFSGTAVFVNDTIGNGILLEQQTAAMGKVKLRSKETSLEVNYCCSIVFADTINSQFIVRVSDNSINPYDVISIIKLNIENTKRTWKISNPETVEFKAKKYGTSSYIISAPKLAIGQYGIYFKDTYTVNLFGVKLIKENF
jgi:hypothetical protein